MSIFSDRLAAARKDSDMLQAPIADYLKITRSAYSAWESGRNEPPLDTLVALCKLFNVSADYLLGLSDVKRHVAPVSISPVSVPRDPLADLTPEQRTVIEASLAAFRAQNLARETQEA